MEWKKNRHGCGLALTCVEDLVPLLLQERGRFGHPALDDHDAGAVDVPRQKLGEQCRRGRRDL